MAADSPASWLEVTEKHGTLAAAILGFATGFAFLLGSAGLEAGTAALPGPAVFPGLAAAGLMVSSVVLGWRSIRAPADAGGDRLGFGHRNSLAALVALLALAAVFEAAGFVLTGIALVAVLTRLLSKTAWWRALLFAVLANLLFYALFTRLLGVALPAGLLSGG